MAPRSFHAFDVALHLLNGLILLLLCRILLKKIMAHDEFRKKGEWMALLIMTLFLLHPLQTQAVNYATQRMAQLEAFFNLGALVFYLVYRLGLVRKPLNMLSLVLAGFFSITALLSKGNAATIPLQFLLLELVLLYKERSQRVWSLVWVGVIAAGAVVALVGPNIVDTHRISHGDYVLSQSWVLLQYVKLFVYPLNQAFDHYVPTWENLTTWLWAGSMLIHGILVTVVVLFARKRPIMAFGIGFFYLAQVMEAGAIPLKDLMVEHRMYLPLVGLAFVVGDLFFWLPKKGALVSTGLITLVLGALTWQQNNRWTSTRSIWEFTLNGSPNSPRALNYSANIYLNRGDTAKATELLEKAIEYSPNYVPAMNTLSSVYIQEGKIYDAEQTLNRIHELEPRYYHALMNHGVLRENRGDYSAAIKFYQRALSTCKGCNPPHISLGTVYLRENSLSKAEHHFLKAMDRGSKNPRLFNNYGHLKLISRDTTGAISLFKQSAALDSTYINPRSTLGEIFLAVNDSSSAIYYYKQIFSIDPTNPSVASFVSLFSVRERD